MKKTSLEVKRKTNRYYYQLYNSPYQQHLALELNKRKVYQNIFIRPKMERTSIGEDNKYVWLLKPTGFNRGRGIHVFNNLNQLEKLMNEYYDGV